MLCWRPSKELTDATHKQTLQKKYMNIKPVCKSRFDIYVFIVPLYVVLIPGVIPEPVIICRGFRIRSDFTGRVADL